MKLNIFWFIPTHGDGRFLASDVGRRPATFEYYSQIARAADSLGYEGVLLPTGRDCEDAWVTAAGLAAVTQHLKFLVAVRPGLVSPTVAHRMATTFDRQSRGRVLINVVTGGNLDELHGDGLYLSHSERYEQTDEFLSIWRGLDRGESVDHEGKHLRVTGARDTHRQYQGPIPIYFGGSSPDAMKVAAKYIDLYLTWGEPPAQVKDKIAAMRDQAAKAGREVRFGIRLHVVVRDTVEEARWAAEKLVEHLTPEIAARSQQALARHDSDGQRRMLELQRGGGDSLWLRPDLWAGIGQVRGGAGTAMVGDGPTVAALMQEYADLGIDTFILSGYPHLEEAYHFAEHVFPHLSPDRESGDEKRGEALANGALLSDPPMPDRRDSAEVGGFSAFAAAPVTRT